MLYFVVSCLFLCVVFLFGSRILRKLRSVEEKPKSDNNTALVKYDVFVSFRGEDIRDRFLSHLINTFQREKINAFVDDKLERGVEIWPSLVQAIEGSLISLVIFSQDYASSRWCLEELVTMMKCREKYGQIVIPIFYHVKSTDVRHQSGSYKNAFDEHRRKYNTKVQTWKRALNKCADLSGIKSSEFQNDAELLREIVNLVLMRLGKLVVNLKGLVGIDKKIEDVESLLCKRKEPKDIRLIGIWGMGGIGKTTLAEEVYNKLRSTHEYDGYYFLANERAQSSKHELIILKERVFCGLLGYVVKIDTPNSLPDAIVWRIGRMKVLIVLDDVNDSDHLGKLLGSLENFGSGSRIIVTTRDQQVLTANKANDIYQLRGLSSDKALELFKLNAFNQSNHEREYDKLSERVVNYANGIPLVLKILAHLLHGNNKEVWESELDKLKKIPLTKVYDVMKLSYDDLDRKQQQILLDLACFFLRLSVEVDVDALKSLLKNGENDNSVAADLEKLKDKALITLSEDKFVSMHDSLQEMACEFVRRESIDDPRSRSQLWDPDDIYEALKKHKGTEAIRSIQLQFSTTKKQKLSPRIFAKMSRLQFLEIYMEYTYDSFNEHNIIVEKRKHNILAKGLEYLPTELRFLSWEGYPLKSLPENFAVEKLVILRMPKSKIEKLWHGVKNLVKLKELDLNESKMLKELPNLSKALNLKVLVLRSCSMLTSVHPSVFSQGKLEKLDLCNCESITILTSDSLLCNLSYLDLDFCKNLMKFSLMSKNMKELSAQHTKVKALPSSFGLQIKLKSLLLEGSAIDTLPELPPSLDTLIAQSCTSLANLPELPRFLKTLNVQGCESLHTLPELPLYLETLNTESCTSLQALPELPPFLKTLNVEECESFRALPELPPSLETLNVKSCTSLQTLPEIPLFLKSLNIQKCKSIQTLPELPPSFETLDVKSCTSLQTLPELPLFLKTLNVEECESLQNLPELPLLLENLNVEECKSLQTLPELPQFLKALNVRFCTSLQILPELPHFLKTLDIQCCTSLLALPELPPFLETLNAKGCRSLKIVMLFPSVAGDELKENRKHFMFWNCLKLDESSLVAIGLNAQINVMKFANQGIYSANHGDFENYDDRGNYHSHQVFHAYPGSTVPEWLEYKTTKDYIIIDLSSVAPPSTPLGFIFCFVLGKYPGTAFIGSFVVDITISVGEGGGEEDSVTMYIDYWGTGIELDHVCVMYEQRCSSFLNSRAKNQINFKIEVTIGPQQVLKGFGISLISTSAYKSFIQQMKLSCGS